MGQITPLFAGKSNEKTEIERVKNHKLRVAWFFVAPLKYRLPIFGAARKNQAQIPDNLQRFHRTV